MLLYGKAYFCYLSGREECVEMSVVHLKFLKIVTILPSYLAPALAQGVRKSFPFFSEHELCFPDDTRKIFPKVFPRDPEPRYVIIPVSAYTTASFPHSG